MEPHDPYPGFSPTHYGAEPVPAPVSQVEAGPPPMLRPQSTGEILDRTMALYRRHFWLFAGIGAVPAAVTTLSSAVRLLFVTRLPGLPFGTHATGQAVNPQDVASFMRTQVYFLPLTLLFLLVYGVSKAATARAVTDVSHGHAIAVADSYRSVLRQWMRWTLIVLRQYWSLIWPVALGFAVWFGLALGAAVRLRQQPVLVGLIALAGAACALGGLLFGIINYLRVALAEAAGVVESLGVTASLRRSRALVADRKGRIFLALLLVYALYMVAGGLQLPFALMAQMTRGLSHVLLSTGLLIVQFVASSLVLPVASVALTLFYLDERVRREGYDIEVLMQRAAATNREM